MLGGMGARGALLGGIGARGDAMGCIVCYRLVDGKLEIDAPFAQSGALRFLGGAES